MQHQQMHHYVVDEEVRNVDSDGEGGHQEKQREGKQVRRIEPPDSSLPEGGEVYLMRLSVCSSLRPLQVDTESRDYKEKKDADVAK